MVHWDDAPLSTDEPNSVRLVTLLPPTDASADLGQWVDWRFEVAWDWRPSGAGSIRVYKDGDQVALYAGPNAFNDAAGPNFRVGLYKWNWPTESVDLRIAHYDDIRIERAVNAIPAMGTVGRTLLLCLILTVCLACAGRSPLRTRADRQFKALFRSEKTHHVGPIKRL